MIHETAIVEAGALIADGVEIGPYSVVGSGVEIASGTVIGPHVVIMGPCKIGNDNRIFQFSSIGEAPQDKKYSGEPTELIIGDRNVIREYVTLNRGTDDGSGKTVIGSDNLFMAYSHVAHDCLVGDHTVFANAASLSPCSIRSSSFSILKRGFFVSFVFSSFFRDFMMKSPFGLGIQNKRQTTVRREPDLYVSTAAPHRPLQ